MALIRTPLGEDINGEYQAVVGRTFIATTETLDADGTPRDLTNDAVSAVAFAPKDASKPVVTLTKDADQVNNRGKSSLVIDNLEITAARAGTSPADDWQLDLLLDPGTVGEQVVWRLATLPVDVSLAT